MLCKMNSGVCETLKAMIHLPSTRSYDSFDHTHTHTHTPARVVFSVCDCFVTVCRDCVDDDDELMLNVLRCHVTY